MKPLSHSSFAIAVVVCCLSLFVCCSKPAFRSGTGLYSVKQYHCYQVLPAGDTAILADTKIGIVSMDNNYLSWNGITFHVNTTTDSVITYINDSLVSGAYQVLYTLQYVPESDQVVVMGNTSNKFWRSF